MVECHLAYFRFVIRREHASRKILLIDYFMMEVPTIWKPVHQYGKQINGLVSI